MKQQTRDDARVIWSRGCEPPRPPEYPKNNEAPVLRWTESTVTDPAKREGR